MDVKGDMILCDTGIVISLFRKNMAVENECKKIGFSNLALCDITIGEIYFGMHKGEIKKTEDLLSVFNTVNISEDASNIFLSLMKRHYGKQIGIPDALIASIALANDISLYTLNIKDFEFISGLKLYSNME